MVEKGKMPIPETNADAEDGEDTNEVLIELGVLDLVPVELLVKFEPDMISVVELESLEIIESVRPKLEVWFVNPKVKESTGFKVVEERPVVPVPKPQTPVPLVLVWVDWLPR